MAVTPTPPISAAPAAPNRLTDSSAEFVAKADPWMDWMAAVTPEVEATAEAAEANATAAEFAASEAESAADSAQAVLAGSTAIKVITNSLTVGAGAKSLSGLTGITGMANGREFALVSTADARISMWGLISGYASGDTATLTVVAPNFEGSGTLASWWVFPEAFHAISPARAKAQAISFAVTL